MKNLVLPLLILTTLAFGCKDSETSQPVDFKGNWVSKDYVEHISSNRSPKRVLADLSLYITEMVINPAKFKDSIVVYNGQKESAHLPFTRSGDTLKVQFNNSELSEIIFNNQDSTISFVDRRLNRVFSFLKADSTDLDSSYEMPLAFPTIVNKNTLTGDFDYLEQNKTPSTVKFSKFGGIKGMTGFDNYSILVNGDLAESYPVDFAIFSNATNSQFMGFNIAHKDTITLFDLMTDPKSKQIYQGPTKALLVRKKAK